MTACQKNGAGEVNFKRNMQENVIKVKPKTEHERFLP